MNTSVGRNGQTRAWCLLVVAAFLAASALACAPIRLWQVRAQLMTMLEQLPQPDGFHVVAIVQGAVPRHWGEQTCYIAQALVAVGTDLLPDEALSLYVQALVAQDWVLQQHDEDMAYLTRGEREWVSIRTGVAGPIMASDASYRKEKDRFRTFIHLSQSLLFPSRAACLAE